MNYGRGFFRILRILTNCCRLIDVCLALDDPRMVGITRVSRYSIVISIDLWHRAAVECESGHIAWWLLKANELWGCRRGIFIFGRGIFSFGRVIFSFGRVIFNFGRDIFSFGNFDRS